MSERHIRAVQRMRRSFTDQTSYEVLCIIATDTGRDDSPARTSIRDIGERAGCHYNTVTSKLRKLQDEGLIRTERHGRLDVYFLLIDTSPPGRCDNQGSIVTNDCDNHNELSQRLSQIEAELSQLSQRLSQLEALIVTSAQSGGVTEDSRRKEVEEKSRREEYIYIPPDPPIVTSIKTALAEATKTTFWEETAEEYDRAATILVGWEATPEQIAGFQAWWDANGHYNGRPALKTLLSEWRDYRDGVIKKPARAGPESGRKLSRAEAAAAEYAAFKQEMTKNERE